MYVIVVLLLFFNQQSIEDGSLMCHQCQRNDKGRVVRCTKCKRRRYCIPCLNNWYNFLNFCFTLFNVLHPMLCQFVLLFLNMPCLIIGMLPEVIAHITRLDFG